MGAPVARPESPALSPHQVVVLVLVDAAQAADADTAKAHHPRIAQEEDVGGGPPAVEQLPQVVGRLVVAADCTRDVRAAVSSREAKPPTAAIGPSTLPKARISLRKPALRSAVMPRALP